MFFPPGRTRGGRDGMAWSCGLLAEACPPRQAPLMQGDQGGWATRTISSQLHTTSQVFLLPLFLLQAHQVRVRLPGTLSSSGSFPDLPPPAQGASALC